MKLRIKILVFLLLISFFSKAQTVIEIDGKVRNDSVFLQNIQIINLTSKEYSISNDLGAFTINVKLGDSILFTSLAQKDRKIKISNTHITTAKILVYLETDVNKLDEVFVENSFFNSEEYVKKHLTFKKAQLKQRSFLLNNTEKNNIDARAMTDPTYNGGNINIGNILVKLYEVIWEKKIEEKRKKRKLNASIEESKKNFKANILEQFNETFFVENLNIHQDKVYLFIDYSIDNGLEDYYNANDIEIINFFMIQSKKFNEISN